ncbi:hypothetical protein Mapa_000382 [Marchantia paleacea]|nr:hypothetical protein Mapa_000382 [Marchantia paleacea]
MGSSKLNAYLESRCKFFIVRGEGGLSVFSTCHSNLRLFTTTRKKSKKNQLSLARRSSSFANANA